MKNPLSHYMILAKRWAWMVVLGIVICSSGSFLVAKITRPVYQASATLILNLGPTSVASDNFIASVQAVPTYAQLLTSPTVLNPVVAQHQGLTLQQLTAMITVKPVPNTQLIELDVDSNDPRLAMQLANEVSRSFAQFSNTQLPGTIQILPAQEPTDPIRPKKLMDTAIGALVGLGLALALIVLFEWIDDRLTSLEEVQELLGLEILAIFPRLSKRQLSKKVEERAAFAEGYRMLCASLNVAQKVKPFKLVMVTSALVGEGKSTVAANLAAFLAKAGKHVLLVDTNLRSPTLGEYFQLDTPPNLASTFMGSSAEIEENLGVQPTDIPNLYVLTAGALFSDSPDMLLSLWANQFFDHLRKAPFDYIIFDTPALLPVADTQILASHVQATVLVVDATKTPRKTLLQAKRMLNRTRTTILGVVINKNHWPTHGLIRQYLNAVPQPRTATRVAMLPNTPIPDGQPGPGDGLYPVPSKKGQR